MFQATSAFDGMRSSKWEEPDGAKGNLVAVNTVIYSYCFYLNVATQIDTPSAAAPFFFSPQLPCAC